MVNFVMRPRQRRQNMLFSTTVSESNTVHQPTQVHKPTQAPRSDSLQLDEDCDINIIVDFVLKNGTKRVNVTPLKLKLIPPTLINN